MNPITESTESPSDRTAGIHHITAIASDPQRNLDFYAGILGLRFVKRTVNFDDPGTYHFYYGDESGGAGSVLTFFPWPNASRGTSGAGSVTATAFAVPRGSLDSWEARLRAAKLRIFGRETRFGDHAFRFEDHDGTGLELIEAESAAAAPFWAGGGLDGTMAIRGFHSATLTVRRGPETESMLAQQLGMKLVAREGARARYAGAAAPGRWIDVIEDAGAPATRLGAGVVHHIAVRADSDAQQQRWLDSISRAGFRVTPVQDRNYFHSIYYRERNGVLFEIATDTPGFAIDEPREALGMGLMLPERYEGSRERIRAVVKPITVPTPTYPTLGTHVHRWIPGEREDSLLLLHGTGGDENDLLSLGEKLDAQAGRLSPRGAVLEGNQPRFFRRLQEGVFDLKDVEVRSRHLAAWLGDAQRAYRIDPALTTAVGFSNGANIASAMLLLGEARFKYAILYRPMLTIRPKDLPDLRGVSVLMVSGRTDPIAPAAGAAELAGLLTRAGAHVRHEIIEAGHGFVGQDLKIGRDFLSTGRAALDRG